MKFVEHILKNEVEEIEILIRKIKKNIRLAPKGHVRVSKKGKRQVWKKYMKKQIEIEEA